MSIIAALDSGGGVLSVAAHINGKIVHRFGSDAPHSEEALPLLLGLLSENDLSVDDCDAFAFAAGPGKFSALRLVCAIAKTFAYAKNKSLIAVPSFAALAEANAAANAKIIKCAFPAHREHAYFAICRREKEMWRVSPPRVISVDAPPPAKEIADACGDGFVVYPQLLSGAKLHNFAAYSNAACVASIAAQMLTAGETVPPLESEPLYVRKQVALTAAARAKIKAAGK